MGKEAVKMGKSTKEENVWVDLGKLLCIFVVVAGHCYFVEGDRFYWLRGLVKACVQVMFVFNGYYLAKNKTLLSPEKGRKYIGHLLMMCVCWEAIYFASTAYYADKTQPGWFLNRLVEEMENFSSLNSGPLWYIQNLVFVVLVLYVMQKKCFSGKEVLLVFLLSSLVGKRMDRAFVGVMLGYYLAQKQEELKERGKGKTWGLGTAICLTSFGLMMISYCTTMNAGIWGGHGALIIQSVLRNLFSVSFVWAVLEINALLPIKAGWAGYGLRKISTIIYLSHMLFIQKSIDIVGRYHMWGTVEFFFRITEAVILMSILLGVLMICLSRFQMFRWLKRVY